MAVCHICGKKSGFLSMDIYEGKCSDCRQAAHLAVEAELAKDAPARAEAEAKRIADLAARAASMVITTEVAGNLLVIERHGPVFGQCVLGINVLKDILIGLRDFVGGRSETVEQAVRTAREAAIIDIVNETAARGGSAIIGATFTQQIIPSGGGCMVMVTVTGTAVSLASTPEPD